MPSDSSPISAERLREVIIDLSVAREKEREERQFSEILLNGLKSISTSQEAEEVFLGLAKELEPILKYDAAHVFFRERDAETFTCLSGTDERFLELKIQPQKTFNRVLRSRPLVLADASLSAEWADVPQDLRDLVRSSAYLPLVGSSSEAIIVFSKKETGFFTNRHKALLSLSLIHI